MTRRKHLRAELQGGIEATLLGFTSSIGPLLLFVGILGAVSVAPGYWAMLVTATVVPALALLFRGAAVIHISARAASLTAYISIVAQLGWVSTGLSGSASTLTGATLLAGLVAGSLMFAAASAVILLAGLLRLGNVFKMIPSTVASGISNASAMLMVWLALKPMLNGVWAVSVTAAVMVLCFALWQPVQRRFQSLRLLPAVTVAMLVGLALGLAIEPSGSASALQTPFDLASIAVWHWPALLQHQHLSHLLMAGLPGAVTLALVMILESFTADNVMETRFGLRVDANRQLVALGGANLLGAMLGAVPCTGSPVRCVASWNAGGRGVPAALISIVLTGALLWACGPWLLALPVGVMAGLFLLQAPVIVDQAFIARLAAMVRTRSVHREGTADLGFWITLVISLVGIFGSLIWACFLGIGLSALAVLRSLSNNLTAQWVYLNQYRSRRVRSEGEIASLSRLAFRIGVLRLTGHLFFGNSVRLAQLVDELHEECVAVVIDVSQVRDVDPSGVGALVWLVRALQGQEHTVMVCGLQRTESAELRWALQSLAGVEVRVDLDHGLEAAEDRVLQAATLQAALLLSVPLANNALLKDLPGSAAVEVLALGKHRQVSKGEALFYKDDEADGVWLLEEGTVSILSSVMDAHQSSRLATFGPGQFVGEMGYVDGKARSATARADSPVRALLLDKRAIAMLVEHQPATALTITRNIARELSHRVRSASALFGGESADASTDWANSSLIMPLRL